jgi:hypothetical protein
MLAVISLRTQPDSRASRVERIDYSTQTTALSLLEQRFRTTTAVGMEALEGTVKWVQSDAADGLGMASIEDACSLSLCA